MKRTEDQWFRNALSAAAQGTRPSDTQKEKMLLRVLRNESVSSAHILDKSIAHLITAYPWRFSFCVSAIQAVLCTLIWGTKYTNLLLGFMIGG